MTGVITSTTTKHSLITILQDIEYIHGQLFERTVESGCGSVTCLPGALTMLRFSAFRKMAKYYFADTFNDQKDMFDYGKTHLGEDRWLTHLFMVGAKKPYQIQMCTSAFCKTEAVQDLPALIKQRRRWFLGFITNEVCMLTDPRIWKRYPLLTIIRFMQNTIRTTSLLFFIMVVAFVTTSKTIDQLPVGFIGISLGLNWLMMIYFGVKLKRYKVWLYPVMFVVNPFFNWYYMVYGIFTAGERTWGGPRADAAAADANTTPQQAVENAKAAGDELNIVPESFQPAIEAQRNAAAEPIFPLQPPDHIEGRFAPAERLPGGWYDQGNDSLVSMGGFPMNQPGGPAHAPLHPRSSFESLVSGESRNTSVYMPRRVESIMDPEDQEKYKLAQASQRESSGAYQNTAGPARGRVYELSEDELRRHELEGSLDSLSSYHDHPNHTRNESYSSIGSQDGASEQRSREQHRALGVRQPTRGHVRTGRSPLSRISVMRRGENGQDDGDIELAENPRNREPSHSPTRGPGGAL